MPERALRADMQSRFQWTALACGALAALLGALALVGWATVASHTSRTRDTGSPGRGNCGL